MDAPGLAAWLKNRLTDAEDDWRRLLAAMYAHLVAQPFEAVVDRERVRQLAVAHLQARFAEDAARVAFAAGIRPAIAEGRRDGEPVGRWIPEEAKARLEALVAEKGLINEAWIEELFKQEAAEELLSETLYQSLKDFSTLVPRVLQKVLPSGLGRIAGFAASAGGKMFDEVERLLDGEIRRFLEKGTRRALDRAAAFATDNLDGPTASAGRRNLVAFAMARTGQFHVETLTDARIDELEAIAVATAAHVAEREETREVVDRFVEAVWTRYSGRTVREVLADLGVQENPAFDAWAAASWPVVQRALETPAVQTWIEGLAAEYFAAATPDRAP